MLWDKWIATWKLFARDRLRDDDVLICNSDLWGQRRHRDRCVREWFSCGADGTFQDQLDDKRRVYRQYVSDELQNGSPLLMRHWRLSTLISLSLTSSILDNARAVSSRQSRVFVNPRHSLLVERVQALINERGTILWSKWVTLYRYALSQRHIVN